jgi:hypothetical protein
MSHQARLLGTLSRICAVFAGLIILAGCGGGSSNTSAPSGTAGISFSATSLTFSSGVNVASAAQAITITNSGTATLTFSSFTVSTNYNITSNNCGTNLSTGSTCSVDVAFTPASAGADNGQLTITDNAPASPQTITLNGTGTSVSVSPTSLSFSGVAQGSTSALQSVTLSNSSTSAVAITSITASASFAVSNTCNGSIAASGSCTISVTFTPTASGTTTGTVTIVDAVGTQTVSLTGSTTVSNTVSVTAGFGASESTGPPTATSSGSYYNGVFTTVTVCQPATTNCVTIPNVLVDTGSVGLRVLQTSVSALTLTQNNDGSGNLQNECTIYGDGSFNWGPVVMATVQIGGETASQMPGGSANTGIPIQEISGDAVPKAVIATGQCVASASTPDEYTLDSLGANGILGIGTEPQDCDQQGTNLCDNETYAEELADSEYGDELPYWYCDAAGVCQQEVIPITQQLWNPVAAFSSGDTAGVLLSLPQITSPTGVASETGTLTFGINSASDNTITTQTVYELDAEGNFNTATLNNVTFCTDGVSTCPSNEASGGTFIDSGSNALFLSDETSLNTTDCLSGSTDLGYYCPTTGLTIPLGLTGSNGTSTTVTLSIADGTTLFNSGNADFYNLGGPSCIPETDAPCSLATDYVDLGLPFFFGRPIYVGIAGSNASYPNGYWAF